MSENPYQDSRIAPAAESPPPKRSIKRVIYTGLLVVGGLVVLAALLLPAVRTAREPARRNACKNNMKLLAVALQNYYDAHGKLPPAYTTDENGKPLHSWRTLILPFIEHVDLYKSIDLTKPWDDPVNAAVFSKAQVDEFCCPSRSGYQNQSGMTYDNTTTYLAVVTPESCLQPAKGRSLADITDGTRQTMMLIEVDEAHAVPWMQPLDADEQTVLAVGEDSDLAHASGFNAAFVDGSVHFLAADVPADQRRAMISIAGSDGEILELDESD